MCIKPASLLLEVSPLEWHTTFIWEASGEWSDEASVGACHDVVAARLAALCAVEESKNRTAKLRYPSLRDLWSGAGTDHFYLC